MAAIIEIFGATIIAGIMILSVINQSGTLNRATAEQTLSVNLEKNEVTLARILESDFMKIGYRVPPPAILAADSTSITFLSDYSNTGTTKTVKFYLGNVLDAPAAISSNPRDKLIYREVTGSPVWSDNAGLTRLNLTYFDSTGSQTADVNLIRSIKIKFTLESPQAYDAKYLSASWQKTVYLKNF